mgnify:CR=1 FL=1
MVTVKRGLVVGEKSVIYRGLGIMQMLNASVNNSEIYNKTVDMLVFIPLMLYYVFIVTTYYFKSNG